MACGGTTSPAPPPKTPPSEPPIAAPAPTPDASAAGPIVVGREVAALPFEKRVVATGLRNPRGVMRLTDGSILLAEAGLGDPKNVNTGRLLKLTDGNADGDADDPDERAVLVDAQPSVNILGKLAVNRDEVFGFAEVVAGGGEILATVADPLTGSVVLRVGDQGATRWGDTPGNANSLVHHPELGRWFAVQSFANTVVAVAQGAPPTELTKFRALPDGQDAVPAALAYEPSTRALLVALFSGQIGGDTAGSGVDFVRSSGQIVRVHAETGRQTVIVDGLNAPTDVEVGPDGRLYVLEFCSSFRDPVRTPEEATQGVVHGGFERFTGRLLRISLESREVVSLATGLDLPTNLFIEKDGSVLITEGQGTPGRTIPTPGGPKPLEGRLITLVPPR